MRTCLASFFLGQAEPGLDRLRGSFDVSVSPGLAPEGMTSRLGIGLVNSAIRDVVADCAATSTKILVLCGDCLCAMGCLAGLERSGLHPYLVWFDAHGDFHTPATTLSGHPGGMPLAMITGRGDLWLLSRLGLAVTPDESVCLIGARDLEDGERDLLRASRIHQAGRLTDALEGIPRSRPLWVHFDTDYLNPLAASAMRYPSPGGPTATEAAAELALLAREFNVLGISVSAWAPHLDTDAKTAAACWQALAPLAEL